MTDERTTQIALIGYGNIARSLLDGLLVAGYEADDKVAGPRNQSKHMKIFSFIETY